MTADQRATVPHAHWDRPIVYVMTPAVAVSVAVHGATYVGRDLPSEFPVLWGLHLVAIVAFGAMILLARNEVHHVLPGLPLPRWPAWAYVVAAAAFLYAFVNFIAFFALSEGGTPEVRDGAYILSNHGRLIRTLTADEYHWQQVYIARGFSGHWIVFLLLPLFYFLFREEPSGKAASIPPAV